MSDKYSICKNCGTEFDFTEDEQAFYKESGVDNEPAQCPMCKRRYMNDNQSEGGYYNR